MKPLLSPFIKLTFISCLFAINTMSSQTLADFFKEHAQVYWLGMDFSRSKMIGDMAEVHGIGEKRDSQFKGTLYPAWNNLIFSEEDKYNLKGALRVQYFFSDLEMISELNSKILEPISFTTDEGSIQRLISEYSYNKETGLAAVMLIEKFDKEQRQAIMHFVLFRISDKEVLLQQRIVSEPSGISLKNYWAGAIHDAIKQINRRYYKAWKKAYLKTEKFRFMIVEPVRGDSL